MAESRAEKMGISLGGVQEVTSGGSPGGTSTGRPLGHRSKRTGSTTTISGLTQAMVKSLDTVDHKVESLHKSINSMTDDMVKALGSFSQDVKDSNTDVQHSVDKATKEAAESAKGMLQNQQKQLMQGARLAKRVTTALVGGIYAIIVTGVIKTIKAITTAFEFNVFGWLSDRTKAISSLFLDNIVGMRDALGSLRQGQETAVQWQQSFGASTVLSQELQNLATASASVYRTRTEFIEAYTASQAVGTRGFDEIASQGELIVNVYRATGTAMETTAKLNYDLINNLHMSAGMAEDVFDTANRLQQGLSELGMRSMSTPQMLENLTGRQEQMSTLYASSGGMLTPEILTDISMVSDAYSAQANVDPSVLWDMVTRGMTGDADVLTLMGFGPEDMQKALEEGDYQSVIEAIMSGAQDMLSSGSVLEANELAGILGITPGQLAQYNFALGDLDETFNLLALAKDDAIGKGLVESGNESISVIQQIKNEMELFARELSIGETNLLDIVANLEEFQPYIDTLKGGVDMLTGSLDMAFGPLSPFIKGPAVFLSVLTGIGIATTDLTDDERDRLSILADYGDMSKGIIERFVPQFQDIAKGIMEGIDGMFKSIDGQPSIFQRMFIQGAIWLNTHGVEISNTLFNAVGDMLDTLGVSLDNASGDASLGKFINSLVRGFTRVLRGSVNIILPFVRVFMEVLSSTLSDPSLTSDMNEVFSSFFNIAKDIITTVWEDVISPMLGPMIGTIFQLLADALDAAGLGVASGPLKDMAMYLRYGVGGSVGSALTKLDSGEWTEEQYREVMAQAGPEVRTEMAMALVNREWREGGSSNISGDWPTNSPMGISQNITDSQGGGSTNIMNEWKAVLAESDPIIAGYTGTLASPFVGEASMTSGWQRTQSDPFRGVVEGAIHGALDATAPAQAMTHGVVTFSGSARGFGEAIQVYHSDLNALVTYGHITDSLVDVGDIVVPGQQLATGYANHTHVSAQYAPNKWQGYTLEDVKEEVKFSGGEYTSEGGGADRSGRINMEAVAGTFDFNLIPSAVDLNPSWGYNTNVPLSQQSPAGIKTFESSFIDAVDRLANAASSLEEVAEVIRPISMQLGL